MFMLIATALFLLATLACLLSGLPLVYALLLGLALFMLAGRRSGYSFANLCKMAWQGCKRSLIVLRMLLLIGIITGLWRSSGTIASFISWGIRAITPRWFLLVVFLLTSLMAYALGTSFGVTGTLGVIFMAIARSSGVNTTLTAGIILSAAYVGDRGAPSSSCANLVSAVTGTDINKNVRLMFKTALFPLILCTAIYAVLSLRNPMRSLDTSMVDGISSAFRISLWALLPAAFMLILPICKVPVYRCMLLSIVSAAFIAVFVQGASAAALLKSAVLGYASADPAVNHIFGGGGIVSMLQPLCIVPLSSAFAGIFEGTHSFDALRACAERLSCKLGRFPALSLFGAGMCMLFCNQTISTIMCSHLFGDIYTRQSATNEELAQDISNGVCVLSSIIPWCIACSGPLHILGAGSSAILYAFYPMLLPLCWTFLKKRHFPPKAQAAAAE